MENVAIMIRALTPQIQRCVDMEFAKLSGEPEPGTALDQVNLKNGDKVIYEYLEFGENGLAFDHLTYMIEESGITLSPHTLDAISKISDLMA
ncbi:hypothetical protein XMM379_003006 [Aliiroseovarius sp. xm-m-379]|uniref:MafI family immunity protein n=1 Tax=Aliiroseovarius TaxID=1658781 RepID=UPI0015696F6D|nr:MULTISPECIES: MafI family immunity protein [Aliiroseovarius]NRP26292.1 hypothetical protein [Aliiroseovarius sp. xm-m-379]NRP31994.1 hypothetical protein [Aliiroseovarius sp. xm-m-314]NRP35091.1 hypothetical protein [Aliiroseovarius sp. xm-a-104]NRP45827.1 hypothetical protein [Aliiroseovarius sp. xm-m-378]NRP51360.1 hypothetical protein [Aliiroseovarius sp. xm-m-354]